jgi:hypothetical protein
LIEPNSSIILTMHFAKEVLEKIQPLMENVLQEKHCKLSIYVWIPMPGWQLQVISTTSNEPARILVERSLVEDLAKESNMLLYAIGKRSMTATNTT